MTPKRIKDIRKYYGLTQVKFADFLMINYETYRTWEEGRYSPSSPAVALLYIAEKNPETFIQNRRTIIEKVRKAGVSILAEFAPKQDREVE